MGVEHDLKEKSIQVIHEIEEEAKEIVEVLDEEFLMIEETIQELEEQVTKTLREKYRYFVYAGQTAVLTASSSGMLRFLAFSSDFGEAFRPAVPQVLVKGSYFVSVGYIVGAIAESAYEVCDKPAKTIVETVAHETFFPTCGFAHCAFLVHPHRSAQKGPDCCKVGSFSCGIGMCANNAIVH